MKLPVISQRTAWGLLCVAMLAQCVVTSLYNLTHFYEMKKSALDGLLYTQLLFNSLHGHGLTTTLHAPFEPQHWFAIHFSPIMYLLVPVYALFPHMETLLLIHTTFIALAAWPLFLCARHILVSPGQALCIAIMYLISPYVVNAAIWDFHEIAFAPLCFAFMLLAVVKRNKIMLLLFALLLVSIKEHYGLAVFGFGLLWAWHWKDMRFGLAMAASGIIVLALVLTVIMPHFSLSGAPAMLNEDSKIDRYSWVFNPTENLRLLGVILSSGFFYLSQLVVPLLFLPLRAFIWLFPAAPDLAVNVLANNDMMRDTLSYHTAAVIPVILVALSISIKNYYSNDAKLKRSDLLISCMAFSLFLVYSQAGLPLNDEANLWEFSTPRLTYNEKDRAALNAMNRLIPPDAPLAGQNNVLPHLPPRYKIFHYPESIGDAEFLALYTDFPFQKSDMMLGAPYSVEGFKYFNATKRIFDNTEWGVIFYQDDWLLLKRNAISDPVLRTQAIRKLQKTQDHYLRLWKDANHKSPPSDAL